MKSSFLPLILLALASKPLSAQEALAPHLETTQAPISPVLANTIEQAAQTVKTLVGTTPNPKTSAALIEVKKEIEQARQQLKPAQPFVSGQELRQARLVVEHLRAARAWNQDATPSSPQLAELLQKAEQQAQEQVDALLKKAADAPSLEEVRASARKLLVESREKLRQSEEFLVASRRESKEDAEEFEKLKARLAQQKAKHEVEDKKYLEQRREAEAKGKRKKERLG